MSAYHSYGLVVHSSLMVALKEMVLYGLVCRGQGIVFDFVANGRFRILTRMQATDNFFLWWLAKQQQENSLCTVKPNIY